MLKIELVRIDDSNCFAVPIENDVEGTKITNVFVEDNQLSDDEYMNYGPRKIGINHLVDRATSVYANIETE